MKKLILFSLLFFSLPLMALPQFLSNLRAKADDALFTTYAAPASRSEYKIDQGYQLLWNDQENNVEFTSKNGINIGIAFNLGKEFQFRLKEFYSEPVITTSYSDLVRFYYYPFKDVRIDIFFDVYSSREAIEDIRITNEGRFPVELELSPYYYYPSNDTVMDIAHQNLGDLYSFPFERKRDGWMIEHTIPLTEKLKGFIMGNIDYDSVQHFLLTPSMPEKNGQDPLKNFKMMLKRQKNNAKTIKVLMFARNVHLQPGDITQFRLINGISEANSRIPDLFRKSGKLLSKDPDKLIREDEKLYSHIQPLVTGNRDYQMFYWSCFSLLQQCMMPPEGKCSYNYYVFSREPKWGWGYGGQVFHESLSMLAYAYMNPLAAMNSQRVFIERQHKDGYINYRTGPYLDETIEYQGKLTTSAPWFNYENLEIYRITKDKKFLEDVYIPGKKFYNYWVSERDSNKNGLCEWGAEAELESVRDARVAVWDKVGWPSNFEGPDLNSMLAKEARSLGEIADILGKKEDTEYWKTEFQKRKDLINKFMWDPLSNFYYNVNRNDQTFRYQHPDDLKIKEITGILPLWAGVCDSMRCQKLIRSITNPDEFWRPYGIPSLSARDDYYNPIGYWNGPVWVQWNYLVFRGLLENGFRKEAEELAAKVLDNMIWHLKNDHVFWEFYSADEHQAGWNKTYIWAGIAARFLIDLEQPGKTN
ncbi:MAG: trehalase family glycosidase [Bacteroidetes bacterium]|nr:trehalase family glycosidase [Bacteroidota bacterium]